MPAAGVAGSPEPGESEPASLARAALPLAVGSALAPQARGALPPAAESARHEEPGERRERPPTDRLQDVQP